MTLHFWPKNDKNARGGGLLPENWVGMWGTLPETLTLFLTKICDFPYPMKPVRLLIYVFVDLKVRNIQWPSYHFDLIDQQNIVLIYSVTIFERITMYCAPSRIFQKALNLIFPKLSSHNIRGFHDATILSPSFHGVHKECLAQWPFTSDLKTTKMPGGGGYFQKIGWGCGAHFLKPLPYFWPKSAIFPTLWSLSDSWSMFLWTWRCAIFSGLLIILILLTNKTLY